MLQIGASLLGIPHLTHDGPQATNWRYSLSGLRDMGRECAGQEDGLRLPKGDLRVLIPRPGQGFRDSLTTSRLDSTLAVRWTRLIRRSTQWTGLRPEFIQLECGFNFQCPCCRLFFITRYSAVCRLCQVGSRPLRSPPTDPSCGTSDPRARSASGSRSSSDLLGSSAQASAAKEHLFVLSIWSGVHLPQSSRHGWPLNRDHPCRL